MTLVGEEKRAYQREWVRKNREKANAAKEKIRERNRQYVEDLKRDIPCVDCGQTYPPYVMDFDHLRDKILKVSRLVNHACSLEKIDAEIAKCELVCANCHRIRTHTR